VSRRVPVACASIAFLTLAACSDSAGPRVSTPQFLYVATPDSQVMAFALPLSPSSAPLWTLHLSQLLLYAGVGGLAADTAGDIAVCVYDNSTRLSSLDLYRAPTTAESQPAAVISGVVCYRPIFDRAGALFNYSGAAEAFNIYTAPFTSQRFSSRAAQGDSFPSGVAIDLSSRLYVAAPASTPPGIDAWDPPYTTRAFSLLQGTQGLQGIATDRAGNLFALESCNQVNVFLAPVSASSVRAVSFSTRLGAECPSQIVVDAQGQAILNDGSDATLIVVETPLSDHPTETFTLTLPGQGSPSLAMTP
jgi:hypothetical protein